MGITGLWKIVEPTATEIPLECLEGKKLAIGKLKNKFKTM